jgi:hypothetical protein
VEAHRVLRRRDSHIFLTIGSQMAVRLSAFRAGRPLAPARFLVRISVKRLSRPPGHSAAGRFSSTEKSNDLIRNRNRDLPDCSVVPKPTMLRHVQTKHTEINKLIWITLGACRRKVSLPKSKNAECLGKMCKSHECRDFNLGHVPFAAVYYELLTASLNKQHSRDGR